MTNATTDNKAKDFIQSFTAAMEAGTLPAAVAKATITPKAGNFVPSDSWSRTNQVYMLLAGTDDARGFNQWQAAGRKVKKGAKAFYIMAPLVKMYAVKDSEGNEKKDTAGKPVKTASVYGFKWIPVFRYEDTEGQPLPERPGVNIPLPELAPVADAWGLRISYRPYNGQFYGCYTHGQSITLATTDEQTFFHELAHAADDRNGSITKGNGQRADNEIVAELSAACLMDIYGRRPNTGYTADYLKHYAGNERQAISMIGQLIKRIDAAISLIITTAEGLGLGPQAAQGSDGAAVAEFTGDYSNLKAPLYRFSMVREGGRPR